MPTERFLNLPNEKRRRILLAAAEEFTRVPYDKVSINKIIHAARIPRGSFYQYFTDKQDLLEYIMKDFREKMLGTAEEALIAGNGDPFAVFPALMERVFEISEHFYNPEFFRNIYSCACATHFHGFKFFRLETEELLELFEPMIDYPPFDKITQELKNDIIGILITLLHNAVGRCFIEGTPVEVSLEEFKRKMNIIKNCSLLKGVNM